MLRQKHRNTREHRTVPPINQKGGGRKGLRRTRNGEGRSKKLQMMRLEAEAAKQH